MDDRKQTGCRQAARCRCSSRSAPLGGKTVVLEDRDSSVEKIADVATAVGIITGNDGDVVRSGQAQDRFGKIRLGRTFGQGAQIEIENEIILFHRLQVPFDPGQDVRLFESPAVISVKDPDQIEVADHRRPQELDHLVLQVEITVIQAIDPAGVGRRLPIHLRRIIEIDIVHEMHGADDIIGLEGRDQVWNELAIATVGLAFHGRIEAYPVGVEGLQAATLGNIGTEALVEQRRRQAGLPLIGVEQFLADPRCVFGNAHPRESLSDIGLDHLFERIGCVITELPAVSAMHRYFCHHFHKLPAALALPLFRSPARAEALAFILEKQCLHKESLKYDAPTLWLNQDQTPSRLPMKLVKVKFRGLGPIPETEWLKVQGDLNLIHVPEGPKREAIATALESLNPPYRCRDVQPFRELPRLIRLNDHLRTVKPHKRTIMLGVYDSDPDLVAELAVISPLLFETDLIEVGRRLDYSRWINFIELASSTRWSEIAEQIMTLRAAAEDAIDGEQALFRRLDVLQPTDRIKGALMRDLSAWVEQQGARQPDSRKPLDELHHLICRAESFSAARQLVRRRLPLSIVLSAEPSSKPTAASDQAEAGTPLQTLLTRLVTTLAERLESESETVRRQVLATANRTCRESGFSPLLTTAWHQSRLTLSFRDAADHEVPLEALPAPNRMQVAGSQLIALITTVWGARPIVVLPLPEQPVSDRAAQELAASSKALAHLSQCFCVGDIDRYFPGEPRLEIG